MKYPPELAFLDEVFLEPSEKYRKTDWLESDFPDSVWLCNFNQKNIKELDWDVTLYDGSSLLDAKNEQLLDSFKYLLTSSTQASHGAGYGFLSLASQRRLFWIALYYIDYFLLYGKQYSIAEYGLAAITSDDLKAVLDSIAECNNINEALFDWTKRVEEYLISEIVRADPALIKATLDKRPGLSVITPEQEDASALSLPSDMLIKARAILCTKGMYIYSTSRKSQYNVNTRALSREIYKHTIQVKQTSSKIIAELSFSDGKELVALREYQVSPVSKKGENDRMTKSAFTEYRRTLYNIGILHELNLPAPEISDLTQVAHYQPTHSPPGRFRTLPSQVVFNAARNAMEFHIKYGKELISSYCRVALSCLKHGCKPKELSSEDFMACISPVLKDIGVSHFRVIVRRRMPEKENDDAKKQYFADLRNNIGLLELVIVYIGCVQVIVGALTARRIDELINLKVNELFDVTKSWLVFRNAKSSRGMMGLREEVARPIEPVAVEMLSQLERLQHILKRIHIIDDSAYVFATPSHKGVIGLSRTAMKFNRTLDTFCDYFEIPLDSQGRRYYIRQHQLRRFFAILFFYSSSFGGLDTLRWMLGHTDLNHVWYYITETMDGSVLRSAKAQYAAENIHRYGAKNFKELAELIESRYGTSDFSIVETDELENYITELMEDGEVEIEPEFFEDEKGEKMRVITHIKEMS